MTDNSLQQAPLEASDIPDNGELDEVAQWAQANPSPKKVKQRLRRYFQDDINQAGHNDRGPSIHQRVKNVHKPMIVVAKVQCADEITPWVLEHTPRYAGGLTQNPHLGPESIDAIQDWGRGEIANLRARQEPSFQDRRRLQQVGRALGGLSEQNLLEEEWGEELMTYIAPPDGNMVEGPFTKEEGQKRWMIYQNVVEHLKLDPELLLDAWRRVQNPDKAGAILFTHDQMTPEALIEAINEGLSYKVGRKLSRSNRFTQTPEVRQAFRSYQDAHIHQRLVWQARPGDETNQLLQELESLSSERLALAVDALDQHQRNQLDQDTIETLLRSPYEKVRETGIRALGQEGRNR